MADRRRHNQRLLERAVGMLAEDGHLRAVHFLASLTGGTVTARDDRVQHHFVAHLDAVHAVANQVDDSGAIRAENGRQWTLGQSARDKHVEVIERHVAKTDADLARPWPLFRPLANLQGGWSVETHKFQSAHLHRVAVLLPHPGPLPEGEGDV